MSVIVKGMKMPKDCYDCPLHDGETGRCNILRITVFDYMPKECPLVEEERKKGKWEWDAEEGYWCSECKEYVYGCTEEIMEGSYKFCPFCGSENEENQWTEGRE